MQTVILGGKQWPIQEPVFKDLKKIINLYRQLSTDVTSKEQNQIVITLMTLLIPDPNLFPPLWYRLKHWLSYRPFSYDEITQFLQAIPTICKLQTVENAENTSQDPWGEIYAFYACCNRFTWDEIDNTMTLSRSELIQDYWLHNPPGHIIQKAKVGYQYKKMDTVSNFFRKNRPTGRLH